MAVFIFVDVQLLAHVRKIYCAPSPPQEWDKALLLTLLRRALGRRATEQIEVCGVMLCVLCEGRDAVLL